MLFFLTWQHSRGYFCLIGKVPLQQNYFLGFLWSFVKGLRLVGEVLKHLDEPLIFLMYSIDMAACFCLIESV